MKFNQTEVAFSNHNLKVDKESGIIYKVLLARVGKVKGHGMYADSTFTQQIVDKGNEFGNIGMKARFGHPNASSTTLGTYIGRWKNFSLENGNAYADLHLDEITKKVQVDGKGISMFDYITEMASANPDMFGNSIVFKPAKREVKQEELKNSEIDKSYDNIISHGEDTSTIEREYARIDSLTASDLVDSPAATESLFDSFNTDEDFAYHMTTFLDSNPKIYKLLSDNPEVIDGFMTKYNDYKQKKEQMSEQDKELNEDQVTFLGGILKKFGYEKVKLSEEDLKAKELAEKELKAKEDEASKKLAAEQKELAAKKKAGDEKELSEDKIALNELQKQFDAQKSELAKFTTKPAGAKPTIDPNVGNTELSENEKNLQAVAEDFKKR